MRQERLGIRAAVGARVCYVSPLIQMLARQHGFRRRQADLVAGLLLQCRRGQRQRGGLGETVYFRRANDVLERGRCPQKRGAGLGGGMPLAQLVFQIQLREVAHRFINDGSVRGGINGALVVVNQAQGGGLTAAGRQRRGAAFRFRLHRNGNVVPQRGRDFEPHQHVQRLSGNLRMDCIHVEQLRRLNGAL